MTEPRILADLRTSAGMSQSKVAERMGVTSAQVSRIEAQYPDVMFPTLRTYLDAIGADIRFVLEDGFDVLSGDIEADASRAEMVAKRKADRTRRAADHRAVAL